jgi:predicted nucleic acid-binding protein
VVSNFFVDTSALAKRYVIETGSSWVLSWIEPTAGNVILIAESTLVEMRSILARRVRGKALTLASAALLRNDFLLHAKNEYLIIYLDTNVITIAETMVDKYTLRTLDAIQLASAIEAVNLTGESITFISGDTELLNAAKAEGFSVDNPNLYP